MGFLDWFFKPATEINWHRESLKFLERDRHARSIDPHYYEVEDRSEAGNVEHKPISPDDIPYNRAMSSGNRESRARAIPTGCQEASRDTPGSRGERT